MRATEASFTLDPDNRQSVLPIVVVNLARAEHRREHMRQELAATKLPYQFFSAVDAREDDHPLFRRYDSALAVRRFGRELNRAELACWSSHFLLWQACIELDRPVLILEDDVSLAPNFRACLDFSAEALPRFGAIRFSLHKSRRIARIEPVNDRTWLVRVRKEPMGCSGYGISPAGAKALVDHAERFWEPVDLHMGRFWRHGIPIYSFIPTPVRHDTEHSRQSQIEPPTYWRKAARQRWTYRAFERMDKLCRELKNLRFLGRWEKHNRQSDPLPSFKSRRNARAGRVREL